MERFLKQDTESTITVDKSDCIEVKVIFSIENAINKIKWWTTSWEKVFPLGISDEVSIQNIF